jgi:hypothetical protein
MPPGAPAGPYAPAMPPAPNGGLMVPAPEAANPSATQVPPAPAPAYEDDAPARAAFRSGSRKGGVRPASGTVPATGQRRSGQAGLIEPKPGLIKPAGG